MSKLQLNFVIHLSYLLLSITNSINQTYGIGVNQYFSGETNEVEGDSHENDFRKSKFEFLMPNVHPSTPELYLCTPVRVDFSTNYYIIGYEPNASMNTAHHMLLYGCGEPGSLNQPYWNCGEMAQKHPGSSPPCGKRSHSQIMYAWARDAPRLDLPDGVGFKVGKESPIKYMVLQVHYAHIDKFKDGSTDDSGVIIHFTKEPMNKLAGVLLLGSSGMIAPMKTEYMETACEINEKKTVYPFAYRTHTHSLGKVVSGYKVREDENGIQHWTLLGKRDPLTPQMFYPVENKDPIIFGDVLAARCTMESHRNRITEIGATNDDEMCNFYLMYYVENDDPLSMKYCFSPGPPNYYWNNSDTGLHNIPNLEASTL